MIEDEFSPVRGKAIEVDPAIAVSNARDRVALRPLGLRINVLRGRRDGTAYLARPRIQEARDAAPLRRNPGVVEEAGIDLMAARILWTGEAFFDRRHLIRRQASFRDRPLALRVTRPEITTERVKDHSIGCAIAGIADLHALVIQTSHIKQGWLRRNGLPESDQATTVEFFVRHGDHLTYTSVITDPVYLTEPIVRTTDFARQPVDHGNWLFACDDGEQIFGRAPDQVPNYLLGQNPFVKEYADKYKIPLLGHLGGPETMYPEFVAKLKTATAAEGTARTLPAAGPSPTSRAVDPEPHDGEIHVMPLRDQVYLLTGDGANMVLQVGDQGAFVVDSGTGALADKTIAAIRKLSGKPIQFIANTGYRSDHTGGNPKLRASGADPSVVGSFFALGFADAGVGATIMAHQNVQNHMYALKAPPAGIPSDTFLDERRRTFHNGDAIEMFLEPNAVTDADSIVQFRRADIIVMGDIFTTTQYPFVDVKNGGSVQGEIKALNDILNRTVYQHESEGGTIVVPGHGYVCDEHEVVEYRDMVAIIRDRVQAMIKNGATLEQVKAARPTADYDSRYGSNTGPWTTNMFVEAVYADLKQARK